LFLHEFVNSAFFRSAPGAEFRTVRQGACLTVSLREARTEGALKSEILTCICLVHAAVNGWQSYWAAIVLRIARGRSPFVGSNGECNGRRQAMVNIRKLRSVKR